MTLNFWGTALTFLLLIPFAASADDCKEVDMRVKGGSMEASPTFNQGKTGYCWAYSGTQLVSAVLKHETRSNNEIPRRNLDLSPSVSMNQALSENLSCLTPCEIFNSLMTKKRGCAYLDTSYSDNGYLVYPDIGESLSVGKDKCEAREVGPDLIENFISNSLASQVTKYKNQIEVIENLSVELAAKDPQSTDVQSVKQLQRWLVNRFNNNSFNMAVVYNSTVAPKCFDFEANTNSPFKGSSEIQKAFQAIGPKKYSCEQYRTPSFHIYTKSNLKSCSNSATTPVLDSIRIVEKINESLNRPDQLPISIDYCYSFLFEGTPAPATNPWSCKDNKGRLLTDHKSIIIGRRLNSKTQKCEYLLRNTFGNNCNKLHPNFRDSCEEEKKKFGNADIWIQRDLLEKVVHGMSRINSN